MNKGEFKVFCKEDFTRRRFRKHKNGYYLNGPEGFLCGLFLQKSDYGSTYYVNCCFHLQTPDDPAIPTFYDMDMDFRRIRVMSKTIHNQKGETFFTGQIRYEDYTADELKSFLTENLKNTYYL